MNSSREEPLSGDGLQTCRRCYCQEKIPTHQFVTFDIEQYYLCRNCWEDFRRWYFWGRRPVSPRAVKEF